MARRRRSYTSEFKIEAVKLVRERGCRQRKPPVTWTFRRMFCANG